jgi:hypothetical protein
MLQIEDRKWVESSLKFWEDLTPDKFKKLKVSQRIVDWNIQQLIKAAAQIANSNLPSAYQK